MNPNLEPVTLGSTATSDTVPKLAAITKLRENVLSGAAMLGGRTTNVPTVAGRLNVPDPSAGPAYPANSSESTNAPTDTDPTLPLVPGPPPTVIVLPRTAPATRSDRRAGTLVEVSPVPATVM